MLIESQIDYTYDQQNRLTLAITRIFYGKKWVNISKVSTKYKSTSTGIFSQLKEIKFYPNPSSDYFMVAAENKEVADINIYTLTRQKIENIKSNNLAEERVDISNYTKGIYLIEIKQGNEIFRSKLKIK